MASGEKQIKDQMSSVILLAEWVRSALDEVHVFKSERSNVGKQVDGLSQMLNTVAGLLRTTPFLYERPIRRIIPDVFNNLERALTLVKKCKPQSVIRRVLTIISVTDFRKVSNFLESSIGDMKWLLGIFDQDSASTGIMLSPPPIASNDLILSWVWSYIAAIQMGQLAVRVKAAIELRSLALDNDRNKKIIVEEGGVFPLLKLLKEESSPEAQIAAMEVLYHLASDQETVGVIMNEGGGPVIVQVLRHSPGEVQTRAASLALRMAEHNSVAQAEFDIRQLHPSVDSTLEDLELHADAAESNADLRRAAFKTNSSAAKGVVDQLIRLAGRPTLQIPAIKAALVTQLGLLGNKELRS